MFKSKIETFYEKHECERIFQGDILRDFHFYSTDINEDVYKDEYPYIVILSQDCDLERHFINYSKDNARKEFNQYLHNILFTLAFPLEQVKEGNHLEKLYGIIQTGLNSKFIERVKQNREERYHYLNPFPDYQIPDLIIDFKVYYTFPIDGVYKQYDKSYLATLNELFREKLSQRFSYYLNRIGLPKIKQVTT